MVIKTVKNKVQKFRLESGFTQLALADMSNISPYELYRIEHNQHVPNLYSALMICEALGKELPEVFYIEIKNA